MIDTLPVYIADERNSVTSSSSETETSALRREPLRYESRDEFDTPSAMCFTHDGSISSNKSTRIAKQSAVKQRKPNIRASQPAPLSDFSDTPDRAEKQLAKYVTEWEEYLVLIVDSNRSERTERVLHQLGHGLDRFVHVFGLFPSSGEPCFLNSDLAKDRPPLGNRQTIPTWLIIHVVYEPFKYYEHCHDISHLIFEADAASNSHKYSILHSNLSGDFVMVEKTASQLSWELICNDSSHADFSNAAPNGLYDSSSSLKRGLLEIIHFKRKYLDKIQDTGIPDKRTMMVGVLRVVQFYIRVKIAMRVGKISSFGGAVNQRPTNSSPPSNTSFTSDTHRVNKKRCIEEISKSDGSGLGAGGGSGDGGEDPQQPALSAIPSDQLSDPKEHISCLLYLHDPVTYSYCSERTFETNHGLASHLQEVHFPQVRCSWCPDSETARYRDNWRLRQHLKARHGFSVEGVKKCNLNLPPIPRAHHPKGVWQTWESMWRYCCPGEPLPQCKYRKPEEAQGGAQNLLMDEGMIEDFGKYVTDTLKDLNGGHEIDLDNGPSMHMLDTLTTSIGRVLQQVPEYLPTSHTGIELHKRPKSYAAAKQVPQWTSQFGGGLHSASNMVPYSTPNYNMNNYAYNPSLTLTSQSEYGTGTASYGLNNRTMDPESYAPSQGSTKNLSNLGMAAQGNSFGSQNNCYSNPKHNPLLGMQNFEVDSFASTIADNHALSEQGQLHEEPPVGFIQIVPHHATPSPLDTDDMAAPQVNRQRQPFSIVIITCNKTIFNPDGHIIASVEEPDGDPTQFWSRLYQQIQDLVLAEYGLSIGQYRLLAAVKLGSNESFVVIKGGPDLMTIRRCGMGDTMMVKVQGLRVLNASA